MRNWFKVQSSRFKVVAGLVLAIAGFNAAGQSYTTGQILPTNAATLIPAANGTQQVTATVQVAPHVFQISTSQVITNTISFQAFVSIGGSTNLIPLTLTANGATALTYVPNASNATQVVTTSATNFNVNIQWQAATTNNSWTNQTTTIFQTQ